MGHELLSDALVPRRCQMHSVKRNCPVPEIERRAEIDETEPGILSEAGRQPPANNSLLLNVTVRDMRLGDDDGRCAARQGIADCRL